jgi:hypothetical protein
MRLTSSRSRILNFENNCDGIFLLAPGTRALRRRSPSLAHHL